jgi:hypothetical protein
MSPFQPKPKPAPITVQTLESAVQQARHDQIEALRRDLRDATERERTRHASGLAKWWRRNARLQPQPQSEFLAAEIADLVAAIRDGLREDHRREVKRAARAKQGDWADELARIFGGLIVFVAVLGGLVAAGVQLAVGAAFLFPYQWLAVAVIVLLIAAAKQPPGAK